MTKYAIRIAVLVLVAGWVTSASAQTSRIADTPHNMNNLDVWGINIPDNRICLPCHAPHNASASDEEDFTALWNHESTDQTFQPYVSLSGSNGGQPEGTSKKCLSCHDGVTAIDAFGGNDGAFNNIRIPEGRPSIIGTDLRDDHPIGVEYPPADLEGYNEKSSFTHVKVIDVNGVDRVECTSCHDPHDNTLGMFLRQTTAGSALCLECHDK